MSDSKSAALVSPAPAAAPFPTALVREEDLPEGVALDREDAPALAREVDGLCKLLSRSLPTRILLTAECAIRIHEVRSHFGIRRERTLAIGWPLLFVLDADELRAALALAISGQCARLPPAADASLDAMLGERLGRPLLARTLSRMWVAAALADAIWLPALLRDGRQSCPDPGALRRLCCNIESHGRAGAQELLAELNVATAPLHARLEALGGADLAGGSHRNAAQAWLWEGLVERLTTALEGPFAALLAPLRAARLDHAQSLRERARSLDQARRAGTLDGPGQLELAATAELLFGARTAYALYRALYAERRLPEAALGLARTLVDTDLERARALLAKLAATRHPVSARAQALLRRLPVASVVRSRQTSVTVPLA